MGWDVTYHPFAAREVGDLYFRCLAEPDYVSQVVADFQVDEFHQKQLAGVLEFIREQAAGYPKIEKTGTLFRKREVRHELPFQSVHAFGVAVFAGFLRKHWYVRGSAFSFLPDELRNRYVTDWKTLVPKGVDPGRVENALTENYQGGVFIDTDALRRLRADYERDPALKALMDKLFSHGRLAVFWKAVDAAIEQGLGLIEATEVVEPNPLDLDESASRSNLSNCDPEGAELYREAALEQLSEAMKKE